MTVLAAAGPVGGPRAAVIAAAAGGGVVVGTAIALGWRDLADGSLASSVRSEWEALHLRAANFAGRNREALSKLPETIRGGGLLPRASTQCDHYLFANVAGVTAENGGIPPC